MRGGYVFLKKIIKIVVKKPEFTDEEGNYKKFIKKIFFSKYLTNCKKMFYIYIRKWTV